MENLITHLTGLLNANDIFTEEGDIQHAVLLSANVDRLSYLVIAHNFDCDIYMMTYLYVNPQTMTTEWSETVLDQATGTKEHMVKAFNIIKNLITK